MLVVLATMASAAVPITLGPAPPRTLAGEGAVGTDVQLLSAAGGEPCSLAVGTVLAEAGADRVVQFGVLGDAIATWASTFGPLTIAPAKPPLPGCESGEFAQITVPKGGWALGVRQPAIAITGDGSITVAPVGDDGRWWHVVGSGTGRAWLSFAHEKGPPTRFRLFLEPSEAAPRGREITVGPHGATVVPFDQTPTGISLVPSDRVDVQLEAGNLLVFGREVGRAEGLIRLGDGAPIALGVTVYQNLPPIQGPAVPVKAGGRVRTEPDVVVTAVWSADEAIATAEARGDILLIDGHSPGEVDLVVRDNGGTYRTVRVIVR